MWITSSLTRTLCGASGWRRLKASNWRVNWPPRSAARRISSSALRCGSFSSPPASKRSLYPVIDSQQVIEIVGHAPRHAAHRLHLLGLPELLLQPGAPAAHLGGADFPFHGGVEPHQGAAPQVVGRSGLQCGQDVRLGSVAGHDNERQVDAPFENRPQSFQHPEAAHREIADGDVAAGPQRGGDFFARGGALECRIVTAAPQLGGDGLVPGFADKEYP